MKSSNKIQKMFARRSSDKETGLSLVETLIAIALFAVIAVMAVSIIATTMSSTTRFSAVTTTQTEVAQASSIMQRDISIARSITVASPYQLSFTTKQNNLNYTTSFFYYNPATSTSIPAGVDATKLPNYSAIIQLRKEASSGKTAQTIIVKGYDPNAYPGGNNSLFTYFDSKNDEINPTALTTQNNRDGISRIGFRIAAKAVGRGSYIQIESSATPADSLPQGSSVQDVNTGLPVCPANISVDIIATQTQSSVSWNAPSGATSYTLYRYNMSSGNVLEQSFVIADPDITKFIDTGLAWGNTYRYYVQSNGPQGSSAQCGGIDGTVVPAQNNFVNLNSLQQSLTATKVGGTAENITAPTVANVSSNIRATTNVESGNRYTVARNRTNQLSWDQSFGTVGFNIYVNGSNVKAASVSGGVLYWQDTNKSFGDITSYTIKAYNAGGESFSSSTVVLVSPPVASTFVQPKAYDTPEQIVAAQASATTADDDLVRPDTSTRATSTDNNILIATRGANTVGYKAYKRSEIAATANCSLVGANTSLNFAGDNVTSTIDRQDATPAWGSVTCYKFLAFNDAGDGALSSDLIVEQFPGEFIMATFESTPYRHINTGVALPSGTQCWVSNPSGGTYTPCIDGSGRSSDNRYALGLFGAVDSLQTTLVTSWNDSSNAYGGYKINKTRTESGGIQDQGSATSTNSAIYVNGSQSSKFQNEMPGSVFEVKVEAKSYAGLTRTSDTRRTVTLPDIPGSMDLNFQSRSQNSYPDDYYRIKVVVNTNVVRGLGTSTFIEAKSTKGLSTYVFNSNTGLQEGYTPTYPTGNHTENTYASLTRFGATAFSAGIGRSGNVTPGCSTPCGASFGDTPEKYPNYYAGGHYRYNSGGYAAGSVDGGTNGPAKAPASAPTPPAAPADSDVPSGNTYDCSVISEDDPLYSSEYGCAYGSGIPRTPSSFRIAAITGNNVTLSWNSSPYAVGYVVSSTVSGVTTKTTFTSNSGNITVPAGSTANVTVHAYNNSASSAESSPVLTIPMPAVPSGLRLVSVVGNTANVAWNAATNATAYQVISVINGATTTNTTTGTTFPVALTSGYSASVTIKAINGGAVSAASTALNINGPATPTGLSLVSLSGGTANISWTAVANTTSYTITRVVSGVSTTYSTASTSYALPVDAGTNATVTVQAANASGASPSSAALTINSPAVPTGLRVTSSSGTAMTVSWNAAANAASYIVHHVVNGATTTFTTTATSYALTVPFGSTSSVTVQAVSSVGGTSVDSAPLNLTSVVIAPAAATNLRVANNTTNSTTVAWNTVTCAAGTPNYQFDWVSKTGTSGWSTTAGYTTYSIVQGQTEQFRVIASCISGSTRSASSYSAAFTFTPAAPAPAAPSIAPASDKGTPYLVGSTATFTFSSNTCASGWTPTYRLYANGGYVKASTTTTTTATVSGSATTTSYTYRLTCTSGTYTTPESPNSPSRSVTVVSRPAAASNFQVVRIYGATVTFSWTGVTAGASYDLNFNGSVQTINSTSTSTISTTKVGTIRNQGFWNTYGNNQPQPDAFPVAYLTSRDGNGYTSASSSSVSVPMARQRIFPNLHNGFMAVNNPAGADSRDGSALVSGDGRFMTILQTDRNLVTYDLATGAAVWNSVGYAGLYIDHWVLNTGKTHAFYQRPAWTLIWADWTGIDMMVQENGNSGSAPGRVNGFKWTGSGWSFYKAHR